MAAIVEDDIRRSKLVDYALQKAEIGLAADSNLNLVFFKFFTFGIDIQTDNLGVRPEIALPHLRRAATAAPDLKKEHGPVNVTAEMGLVGGEIVLPLVNRSLAVGLKFLPETQVILPFAHLSGGSNVLQTYFPARASGI